jgi:hypothetical protein
MFLIEGSLVSSSVTNTTFTNIASLHGDNYGGAMYISTPNYIYFNIIRCVFTHCQAFQGGALFFDWRSPYVYISYTRFENNKANYGDDIYVLTSSCFNKNVDGSIASSVCSTTPLGDRVNCSGDLSQLQNTCSEDVIVCDVFLFFFFFNDIFLYFFCVFGFLFFFFFFFVF